MRKFLAAAVMALALTLTGCNSTEQAAPAAPAATEKVEAAEPTKAPEVNKSAQLKPDVQAFLTAFTTGDIKEARALSTKRCRTIGPEEFKFSVEWFTDMNHDTKVRAVEGEVRGNEVVLDSLVTNTGIEQDEGSIAVYVFEDGHWRYDGCDYE